MAIYRCLLRIESHLAWKSRAGMLSRQGFQLSESLLLAFDLPEKIARPNFQLKSSF